MIAGGTADDDQPLYRTRIASALAPMHSEPAIASQQISQQLAGHDIDVMDVEGDWIRARGDDGYEGWIHNGFVEKSGSIDEPMAERRVSLGCVTESPEGGRRTLPLRAYLRANERVLDGVAVTSAELSTKFPRSPDAIARSAREFFRGTSYIWGGVTPWGADCSGLVQAVFGLHGRILPRDAWQQAELGASIEGDFGALQAGDLLFFSDRPDKKVTHVGVALGSASMVHLALSRGGYAVESLDGDDAFVMKLRERFRFARRL